MQCKHRLGTAMVATIVAWGVPAGAVDYSAAGPETVATSDLPANAGGATSGKLVVPNGAGPYPLIVASHGWSASPDNQVGWAQHFASYGFVVVVPGFPNPLSPDANVDAGIIKALAALYANPATMSPARGKVDATRVGLEGHSAGGLATTVAAADMKPQAVVLFDPVDSNDTGKTAYGKVCSPVLAAFADPGSCNNMSGWSAFKTTSAGPQVLYNVVGSTHCDGENNARALCGPFCGGAADATRQTKYGGNATAFFLWRLKGDAAAQATLTQAALSADAKLASVSVHDAPNCAAIAEPDAGGGGGRGADAGSGGGADASTAADASSGGAPGGGNGAASDGPTGSSSGCACGVAEAPPSRGFLALALAALALVARRRR